MLFKGYNIVFTENILSLYLNLFVDFCILRQFTVPGARIHDNVGVRMVTTKSFCQDELLWTFELPSKSNSEMNAWFRHCFCFITVQSILFCWISCTFLFFSFFLCILEKNKRCKKFRKTDYGISCIIILACAIITDDFDFSRLRIYRGCY